MNHPQPTHPPHGWRTFLIIWCTQAFSVFGSAVTGFAITIWLTTVAYPRPEQQPELAFALAALGLSFGITTMVFAPIAGAWADRHDRRTTLILADTISGVITIILAGLLVFDALSVWLLLFFLVLAAIANAFHDAAFDTSYAMLVPPEKLPRANGMMQTIWALSGILSPALASAIIALPILARQGLIADSGWLAGLSNGTPLALAFDVITFVIAVVALLFVQIPSPQRADLQNQANKPSIWADVGIGASYIWQRRSMLWLLGTFTVANLAGAPLGVLPPLVVKFDLASNWSALGFSYETALALLNGIVSVGGVVGGLLISAWGGLKTRRIYGVLVPMIITGVAQLVYGFSPWFYLTVAMGFLTTAMIPLMNAHSQTIWQTQVPPELQGRVFAVRRVIAQFTFPIGTLLAGVTGGVFAPGHVIGFFGALLAVFCCLQLFNPYLRRVEDKAWLDAQATKNETVVSNP
jgi:MFS family permease